MAEENHDATTGDNTPKTDVSFGAPPQTPVGGGALPSPAPAPTANPEPSPQPMVAPPVEEKSDLQADMESILKGVQLPERHRATAAGKQTSAEQRTYDTTLGATSANTPEAPAAPAPADTEKKNDHLSTVHTLKNDLQNVVQDKKISIVRAAALEQTKRRPEPINIEPPKKNPIPGILIMVLFLFILGAAALFGVYYVSQSKGPQQPQQLEDSLIFAESTQPLSLDNTQPSAVKQQLTLMRQSGAGTLGSMTRIVPVFGQPATQTTPSTQRVATFREFMQALGATPSDGLMRALADNFFMGIHTVDKNAPIIVIPVLSYDNAFKGMLDWEKTMNNDLSPFFAPVPALVTSPEGLVETRQFSDLVMRNYDVRVLKDDTGEILLYYSFPTRNILIIAESPYSFPEILSRLQAQRKL